MKTQIKILFLTILFLIISEPIIAQKISDAKFLFKTWLFLEHNNTKSRYETKFPIKDSSLFNLFQTKIDVKLDTLKKKGFSRDYIFLSINLVGTNSFVKDSAIIYKKTPLVAYIDVPVDNCEAYVLCVNISKGTSYRLKGFYGNDFISLFHEIQANYLEDNNKSLLIKQFFKNYLVDGLDFECLYKALSSSETDLNRFPCLKSCSVTTVTIH